MHRLAQGLLFCLLATIAMSMPVTPSLSNPDTVVLLHGLGRSALSMKRVEWTLRSAGYKVVNFDYPSRRFSVEQLAGDRFAPFLARLQPAPGTRVHFVTHSMGGIILRCYFRDHVLPQLGRIVMIAPPNSGSEVADRLKGLRLYQLLNGPAGQELGTDGLPPHLGPAPGDTGVVAGTFSFNPLFSSWLPKPNDGKVSVASARLESMRDFLTVPYSHTWLMWRKPVLRQVMAFLRAGRFDRPTPSMPAPARL